MKTLALTRWPAPQPGPKTIPATLRPQGRAAGGPMAPVKVGTGIPTPGTRELARDSILRLEGPQGVDPVRVEVWRGTVWLTSTPADGDILLRAGGSLSLRGPWPMVLQALTEATIRMTPPPNGQTYE